MTCDNCGVEHDDLMRMGDGTLLCDECIEKTCIICDICGALTREEDIEADGHINVCSTCYEEGDYLRCIDCGDITNEPHTVYSGHRDYYYVCEHCIGEYRVCNDCGEAYTDSQIWAEDSEQVICSGCSESYYICDDCGCIVHENCVYGDGEYDHYCEACYERRPNNIRDYMYKPDPHFYGDNSRLRPYMGIELEIDKGDDVADCARELDGYTDAIYLKHDGSLDCGIEIVSHPCTLQYHADCMPWADMMDTAREYGFLSHTAKTCGLHVHVNKDYFGASRSALQELGIAKTVLIVSKFWPELIKFSRRSESQLRQWADKPHADFCADDDSTSIIHKCRDARDEGRYQAVNLTNRATIEFRFFRGTLKIDTFMASLQLVETICDFAKSLTVEEIQTLSWSDMVRNTRYTELAEYLKIRGLAPAEERKNELCVS